MTVDEIIAKMREDAEEYESTPDGILGQTLFYSADKLEEAIKEERKSRNIPKRNCDRVNSGEEAVATYCRETGWTGDVYDDVIDWLFLPPQAKKKLSRAKLVEPPDDTEVWVVYYAGEGRGIDGRGLVAYQEKTWCGTIPFDAGPRQIGIELYDDHTAAGNTGRNYIQPKAWFYTEEEANKYIQEHKIKNTKKGDEK